MSFGSDPFDYRHLFDEIKKRMTPEYKINELGKKILAYETAVNAHYETKADDLCWEDDNTLYAVFGLKPKDAAVGDPVKHLENCIRYVRQRCIAGGPWKSYVELEQDNKKLAQENDRLKDNFGAIIGLSVEEIDNAINLLSDIRGIIYENKD